MMCFSDSGVGVGDGGASALSLSSEGCQASLSICNSLLEDWGDSSNDSIVEGLDVSGSLLDTINESCNSWVCQHLINETLNGGLCCFGFILELVNDLVSDFGGFGDTSVESVGGLVNSVVLLDLDSLGGEGEEGGGEKGGESHCSLIVFVLIY